MSSEWLQVSGARLTTHGARLTTYGPTNVLAQGQRERDSGRIMSHLTQLHPTHFPHPARRTAHNPKPIPHDPWPTPDSLHSPRPTLADELKRTRHLRDSGFMNEMDGIPFLRFPLHERPHDVLAVHRFGDGCRGTEKNRVDKKTDALDGRRQFLHLRGS